MDQHEHAVPSRQQRDNIQETCCTLSQSAAFAVMLALTRASTLPRWDAQIDKILDSHKESLSSLNFARPFSTQVWSKRRED